jgi:hypothetical protein
VFAWKHFFITFLVFECMLSMHYQIHLFLWSAETAQIAKLKKIIAQLKNGVALPAEELDIIDEGDASAATPRSAGDDGDDDGGAAAGAGASDE